MAQTNAVLRRVHRWLALGLGVLWLSQALTGLVMVYRWELDDAALAGAARPLDVAALGARIEAIEADGTRTVASVWTGGGVEGRYDLYVSGAGDARDIVRVDGAGTVLRTRASGAGFVPTAAELHQTLFAGDTGRLIVGTSGVLLLVTVLLGLKLAWPARRALWRPALWPNATRPGAARRYAWHRAAGLWLALPALLVLGAGVLLAFESTLEHWLEPAATPAELTGVAPPAGAPFAPGDAFATALAQFPGAELSGVAMPTDEAPWYRIRVHQPDEWRRVYGTSVVYVAAADGRVLRTEDALDAPARRAFLSNLYPVHTGEALGVGGRLLTLLVGLWLLGMGVLGVGLWLARRR